MYCLCSRLNCLCSRLRPDIDAIDNMADALDASEEKDNNSEQILKKVPTWQKIYNIQFSSDVKCIKCKESMPRRLYNKKQKP